MYVQIDLLALLMNNFEHRVLRIERTTTTVYSRSTCRNITFMLCSKLCCCAMQNILIFYIASVVELLICRVHQFGLECIKNCVLYSAEFA